MNKRKGKTIITLMLAAMSLAMPLESVARGWEPLKIDRTEARLVVRDAEIEVRSNPGVIIVTVSHQTPIKIFTILGRLVNSETLNAGSRQFTVPTHGVYIVKVGDLTCKVAV